MMSLAGTSRAVVPVSADWLAALLADPAGAAIPGTAAAADGTEAPAADDAAAELDELPEHPASSIPPASMAPQIARPAAAPNRVRADRRYRLSVFSMPL